MSARNLSLLKEAFFLKAAYSRGANLHFDFFAIDSQSFGLQIRLPHFFSVALGKADVVAVLLTFFIKI